jgi:hypothetical protein
MEEFNALLRRMIQNAGETLQEFSAAIDHLTYIAHVNSTQHHISMEGARAFAEGVRNKNRRR